MKPGELAYVNIDLVGENGVVESNDDRKLTLIVEGGKLLGFGSANPCTEERFDSGSYTTFYGKALAVV
jgi:beta-galactosidase